MPSQVPFPFLLKQPSGYLAAEAEAACGGVTTCHQEVPLPKTQGFGVPELSTESQYRLAGLGFSFLSMFTSALSYCVTLGKLHSLSGL